MVELLSNTEIAQDIQRTTQYYPSPPVTSTLPPVERCPFTW